MNDNQVISAAPRLAKILNTILIIVMVILAIIATIMVASGIFLLFETGGSINTQLEERLRESGIATPTKAAPFAGAVIALAYLYVATVMRGIVQTLFDGNPFVESNIQRLRKTWVIIAMVEIFRVVMTGLIPVNGNSPGMAMETNLSAWFLVFVIAVMAEVFRIGLELKRDQELTV